MSARPVAALMILGAALLASNADGQTAATAVPVGVSIDGQQSAQPIDAPPAVTPDPGEPAAASPEPAKPDAVPSDAAQSDARQPGAVQAGSGQSGPGQPDLTQPDSSQTDSTGKPPAQGDSSPPAQDARSQTDANGQSSGASEAADAQSPDKDPLAPLDDPAQPVDVPSAQAWQVIDWVIATHDNNTMPFMVVDKVAAEVFVFDPDGQPIGKTPALVGMTAGDEATPWVGDREMSNIPPKDRTTPAGRFIANLGPAVGHHDVLWIDYPDAISLHAVISVRNQHRLERLRTPTPDDNRITYGCINVPAEFYAKVIKQVFKGTAGVVYILPDTKALNDIFLAMPQPLPSQPQAQQPSPSEPSPTSQSSN